MTLGLFQRLVVPPQGKLKVHQCKTARTLALHGSIKPREQEDLGSKNDKLEHCSTAVNLDHLCPIERGCKNNPHHPVLGEK